MIPETGLPTQDLRIGVALGGGSARGFAHVGALSALERHQLAPTLVVGTSFGAIIGALYAMGLDPEDIADIAYKVNWKDIFRILDFGLHRAALFSGNKFEIYLNDLFEGRSFDDLARPLVVVTTDLATGERVDIAEGNLARAVRASCSMPGVFSAAEIEGQFLVDGGLGSPLPLATLEGYELDLALGIGAGLEESDSGAIRFAQRCLDTRWGKKMHRSLLQRRGAHPVGQLGLSLAHSMSAWQTTQVLEDGAHYVHTKPPISWFNFLAAEVAMTAGEEALEEYMPQIKASLNSRADVSASLIV